MRLFSFICIAISFVALFNNCKNKPQQNLLANIHNVEQKNNAIMDGVKFSKKEFLLWNYDEAFKNLGNPISIDSFRMKGLPEFRVELYNYLPDDSNIVVKELTWRVDSISNLTIWYVQKDSLWNPVHFIKWNTDKQF